MALTTRRSCMLVIFLKYSWDLQTADKATLEVFNVSETQDLATAVLAGIATQQVRLEETPDCCFPQKTGLRPQMLILTAR